LWGAGFTGPGGAAETLRLAKPMALSNTASLLLLGGGTGGPAETIAGSLGAWVASFEADADLAAVAEQRRANAPEGRRIQVATWDRDNPAFAARSAHHAMSLEAVRGAAMDPVLDSIAAALRPHGHVVLTEMVTDTDAPAGDREFAAWCRLENRLPSLPRMDDITATLGRLHFDVRVVEDLSDRHVSATLAGWRHAVKAMQSGPRPDTGDVAAFVTEAELWLLRIRLMRRFGFRLVRWHAIGTA
jgi:cyclopropane fatty-acyl-phospholipid synthase-like methyltransferase